MSACWILVKRQYRKRHDKLETYLRLLLRKKYHFHCSNKWYKHTYTRTHTHHIHTHTHTHTHTHKSQSVQRNNEYKILWDFNIQTDKVIEVRSPDTVCVNKQNRVSDYWLCYFWWPKHSHQGAGKNWQVPRHNNRITESLECQGSGLTGSYRCSPRQQVMSKRIHQYIKQIDIPADIVSI